jgi:hypothetical protein
LGVLHDVVVLHHLEGVTLLDPALSLLKVGLVSLFDPLMVCPKLNVAPLDFAVPFFDGELVQKVLDAFLLLGLAELLREHEHLKELPLGQVSILVGGLQELAMSPLGLILERGVDGSELGLSLVKCQSKALFNGAHIFIRNGVMRVIG